jgi:putative transcriptional regulator
VPCYDLDERVAGVKEEEFSKLVASIKEAGKIKASRKKASRESVIEPPDIKTVRKKPRVSQREFAMMIGVSTRTLQNWVQGRRIPEGPAKALLKVAVRNPRAVLEALHS